MYACMHVYMYICTVNQETFDSNKFKVTKI